MNLLPPFLRKFGMIPESYKLAMTYEEQLLWLCKHLEDIENEFETFKQTVADLEILVNSYDSRITQNANDITALGLRVDRNATDIAHLIDRIDWGLPFKYLTDNILLTDLNPDLASGYYYTSNYQIRTTLGTEPESQYRVIFDTDTLLIYDSSYPKTFKLIKDKQVSNLINYYVTADSDTNNWVVTRNEISTTTVNQYSDNYQIPTALAVWNAIQSNSGLIEKLPNDISLTDETVPLTTGLYYTNNHRVTTTTGSIIPATTLMIPEYTLFYYDGTQNTFTLLYNEATYNRDNWLKERWYWFEDTSGVEPSTSAWSRKSFTVDSEFNFFASESLIPNNLALSKVIPKLISPATLTTGSYFDIQGLVFVGDTIQPPTNASNTAYCVYDISNLTSLKFRITGGCSNYTWFTTDIDPTDTVNTIHIESMSNQDTGFTDEIIEVVTNQNSHYIVFNFDNTDSVAPSVENFVIEVGITQTINSSSTESEIPSAKCVYQALQNKQDTLTAGTGINITGNVISATGGESKPYGRWSLQTNYEEITPVSSYTPVRISNLAEEKAIGNTYLTFDSSTGLFTVNKTGTYKITIGTQLRASITGTSTCFVQKGFGLGKYENSAVSNIYNAGESNYLSAYATLYTESKISLTQGDILTPFAYSRIMAGTTTDKTRVHGYGNSFIELEFVE